MGVVFKNSNFLVVSWIEIQIMYKYLDYCYCAFIYVLFFKTYKWSSCPTLVIAHSPNNNSLVGNLKKARIISYIFLLFLTINLFFLPPFLKEDLLSKFFKKSWLTTVYLISFFISLLLFTFSVRNGNWISLTTEIPSSLFNGIYERTRHPQCLSIIILWIGIAFYLNSFSILITIFLYSLFLLILAKLEEEDLLYCFGKKYVIYRSLVPFLWIRIFQINISEDMKKIMEDFDLFEYKQKSHSNSRRSSSVNSNSSSSLHKDYNILRETSTPSLNSSLISTSISTSSTSSSSPSISSSSSSISISTENENQSISNENELLKNTNNAFSSQISSSNSLVSVNKQSKVTNIQKKYKRESLKENKTYSKNMTPKYHPKINIDNIH